MGGASTVDALHDRESQMWMPSDLNSLEQLARGIHRRLPQTRTRRWQSSIHGLKLDGRRTLRKSASLLGDSLIPCWKRRRREPIELILLNDVSRSMEAHAALALRTSRAFHRVMGARVFVFHLRPIEVTDLMRRDTPAVQERINAVTAGFQSGTRIADSIRALHSHRPSVSFNRRTRLWIFQMALIPPHRINSPASFSTLMIRVSKLIGSIPPAKRLPPRPPKRQALWSRNGFQHMTL